MDIFEYALKVEKDGEAHYRDMAAKAGNSGLESIFNMLADAEAQHYQVFLQMQNNQPVAPADDEILDQVKNVFQQMQLDGTGGNVTSDQVEVYRQALDVERESQKFYLEKAEELSDPAQKKLCLSVAAEEQRHATILSGIIDYISRPATWLENAEWRHMEEY